MLFEDEEESYLRKDRKKEAHEHHVVGEPRRAGGLKGHKLDHDRLHAVLGKEKGRKQIVAPGGRHREDRDDADDRGGERNDQAEENGEFPRPVHAHGFNELPRNAVEIVFEIDEIEGIGPEGEGQDGIWPKAAGQLKGSQHREEGNRAEDRRNHVGAEDEEVDDLRAGRADDGNAIGQQSVEKDGRDDRKDNDTPDKN